MHVVNKSVPDITRFNVQKCKSVRDIIRFNAQKFAQNFGSTSESEEEARSALLDLPSVLGGQQCALCSVKLC